MRRQRSILGVTRRPLHQGSEYLGQSYRLGCRRNSSTHGERRTVLYPKIARHRLGQSFAGSHEIGSSEGPHAPATVRPSTRKVGASIPVLNSRSLAAVRWRYMSLRLPAMVISLTGKASSPFSIQNPAAPRL